VAGVFSFFTAVSYYIRVRNNAPLPAGFLWIGFPVPGNRVLRLGLVSIDSSDPGHRGRLKWGFSLFDATSPRRTIRVMLPFPIQYFEMEQMGWDDAHTNSDNATPDTTMADGTAANHNQITMTPTSSHTPASSAPDQIYATGMHHGETTHGSATRPANPVRLLL
jgi:hypothetical protein